MSKILLLNTGLKHAQEFTNPFLKRLEVYLSKQHDCIDIRNTLTFDERTFFEYDKVIFIFMTALDSIPSSTLEILQKISEQNVKDKEVYALITCDEYETEKCDLSEKIMQQWCFRFHFQYMGTIKIGSVLFIMKTPAKYVVASQLKKFAGAVINGEKIHLRISELTEKRFMKTANKYWDKQIKKKKKEKAKDAI